MFDAGNQRPCNSSWCRPRQSCRQCSARHRRPKRPPRSAKRDLPCSIPPSGRRRRRSLPVRRKQKALCLRRGAMLLEPCSRQRRLGRCVGLLPKAAHKPAQAFICQRFLFQRDPAPSDQDPSLHLWWLGGLCIPDCRAQSITKAEHTCSSLPK